METRLIMALLLIAIGISLVLSISVMVSYSGPLEKPQDSSANTPLTSFSSSNLEVEQEGSLSQAEELIFPRNRINEEDIRVYEDRVVIKLDRPQVARFTDSGSMEPTFGSEANAIEIIPHSPEEIQVGDIVSYYSEIASSVIIHRVVETGYDENGWYAYFKGDNLPQRDPEKVRFSQIRRLVVMMVY